MGITSHAQNFEDVILWRALGDVPSGFYIDIGAQHPVADSVSKAFYDAGWRGLHVEPNAHYAELLRQSRPDETVIQAAVAEHAGVIPFYEIASTGLSTVNQPVAAAQRDRGYDVVELPVAGVTLDQLFSQVGQRDIHWMKLDIEGGELDALRGWCESSARPWVLVIESTYPNSQVETHAAWEPLVLAKGYAFVQWDGLNRFYLHETRADRRERFGLGPCYWDDFRLPASAWPVQDVREAHEHALAGLRASLAADASRARSVLERERSALRGIIEAQRTHAALLAQRLHRNDARDQQHVADLALLGTRLRGLDRRLTDALHARDQLRARWQAGALQLRWLRARLRALEADNAALEERRAAAAQQLRYLRREHSSLAIAHGSVSAVAESRAALVGTLRAELAALGAQHGRLQRLRDEDALRLAGLREQLAAASAETARQTALCESLGREQALRTVELERLAQHEVESARRIEALEQGAAQQDAARLALESTKAALEDAVAQAQGEISHLRGELTQLHESRIWRLARSLRLVPPGQPGAPPAAPPGGD